VIYNWAAEDSLILQQSEVPNAFEDPDKFYLLFAGNMGKAQALEAVLDAAEILQETAPRFVMTFLGGGVEVPKLKQIAVSRGLQNVGFLPPVSMSDVGRYLLAADAL